jgi:hypothetical protein
MYPQFECLLGRFHQCPMVQIFHQSHCTHTNDNEMQWSLLRKVVTCIGQNCWLCPCKFPINLTTHINDSEYNGHCCKTLQHVLTRIACYVLANFPSISPRTLMIVNIMVIVAKHCNMCSLELLVMSLQISHQSHHAHHDNECNGCCCKRLQHVLAKIVGCL